MACLYVVGTPIGNLSEVSPRVRETLENSDVILAEDTRVTQKLLSALNISGKQLISCHQHNEAGRAGQMVQRMLQEDLTISMVTDAGTPCISDPGWALVREAAEAGVEVLCVPGPTAMASAQTKASAQRATPALYSPCKVSRMALVMATPGTSGMMLLMMTISTSSGG